MNYLKMHSKFNYNQKKKRFQCEQADESERAAPIPREHEHERAGAGRTDAGPARGHRDGHDQDQNRDDHLEHIGAVGQPGRGR